MLAEERRPWYWPDHLSLCIQTHCRICSGHWCHHVGSLDMLFNQQLVGVVVARPQVEQMAGVGASMLTVLMSRASSHTEGEASLGNMLTVASELGHSVERMVVVGVASLLPPMPWSCTSWAWPSPRFSEPIASSFMISSSLIRARHDALVMLDGVCDCTTA